MERTTLAANLLWIMLSVSAFSYAQTSPKVEVVPEPPKLPKQSTTISSQHNPNDATSGLAGDKPEITVTRRGKETIEEYRVRGKVTQVRVIPDDKRLPPYYLTDPLDMSKYAPSQDQQNTEVRPPQWKVLNF